MGEILLYDLFFKVSLWAAFAAAKSASAEVKRLQTLTSAWKKKVEDERQGTRSMTVQYKIKVLLCEGIDKEVT